MISRLFGETLTAFQHLPSTSGSFMNLVFSPRISWPALFRLLSLSLRCLSKLRSAYQTTAAILPRIAQFHLNSPDISPTWRNRPQIGQQQRSPAGRSKLLASPLRGVIVRSIFPSLWSHICLCTLFLLHVIPLLFVFLHFSFLLMWRLILAALLFCIIAVGKKKGKAKPHR